MIQPIRYEDIEGKDGFITTIKMVENAEVANADFGVFYTAHRPCEVLAVKLRYSTAGAVDSKLEVKKVPSGTAVASGTDLFTTNFDLNAAADTVYTRDREIGDMDYTRTAGLTPQQLLEDDSLGLQITGTITTLRGVIVTVYLKYLNNGDYRK